MRLCARIRKSARLAWVSKTPGVGGLKDGCSPSPVAVAIRSEALVTDSRPSVGSFSISRSTAKALADKQEALI